MFFYEVVQSYVAKTFRFVDETLKCNHSQIKVYYKAISFYGTVHYDFTAFVSMDEMLK